MAYPTSGEALQEARTAYNALTASQKELMSSYVVGQLESKENEYAAKGVVAKIDAIGEVANPASNAAIQEARTAYNALTDAQKEFVQQADLQKLVDAENKYPALGVIALIDAIGTVTYPTSGEAIDEAKEAYDGLTEAQKAFVPEAEVQKLTDAGDKYKAAEVSALISSIGQVENTNECKEKIDAAVAAYESLTENQQSLVTNSSDLFGAKAEYEDLGEGGSDPNGGNDPNGGADPNGGSDPNGGNDPNGGQNPNNNNNNQENEPNRKKPHGFCIGYIVMIVSILVYLFLFFFAILRFRLFEDVAKKCKIDKLYDRTNLFEFISVCVAGALFLFSLIVLIIHQCPLTIIFFILDFLVCACVVVLFLIDQQIIKHKDDEEEEESKKQKKGEKAKEEVKAEEKEEAKETPQAEEAKE